MVGDLMVVSYHHGDIWTKVLETREALSWCELVELLRLTQVSRSRVGSVSCSGGRRARALITARCGRTCAPSGGSWRYRRATGTRSTRRSRGSSTARGSRPASTSRTSRYKQADGEFTSRPLFFFPLQMVFMAHYHSLYSQNIREHLCLFSLKTQRSTFLKIHNHSRPQYKARDANQNCFYTSETNVRTSVWWRSFLCVIPPPAPLSGLLFVIFVSHKSLKIEVVNDQPTHFLLNTPPSHPLLANPKALQSGPDLNIIQNTACNYWSREKGIAIIFI